MNKVSIIGPRGIPKEFNGTSGIETYVESRIPGLVKKGSVTCYVRSWTAKAWRSEYMGAQIIAVPTINSTHLDTFIYSFLATMFATLSNTSIVWYHGIGPAFFAWIPRAFGKHVYTTVHSLDYERKKWIIPARLFLYIGAWVAAQCSHRVFVVSKSLKHHFKKEYGIDTTHDAFSLPRSSQTPAHEITNKYGLARNGYVLFLGRLVPEKRIEWLIEAMRGSKIPLVIAGGASHSDKYAESLAGNTRRVETIYTGYVFGSMKQELLSNCKLLVLPSQTEGFPICVAEALAIGKVCLVADFLRGEYKQENPNIHFFKKDSFMDFKQKLRRLV